jgi:hypothetical protein
MKTIISIKVRKLADLIEKGIGLDDVDIRSMHDKGPQLIRTINKNISAKKDALEDVIPEDMRTLLAFVVYKRENLALGPSDDPNDEDAAKILHGDVYKNLEDKKTIEALKKALKKQLMKAGLNIKKEE